MEDVNMQLLCKFVEAIDAMRTLQQKWRLDAAFRETVTGETILEVVKPMFAASALLRAAMPNKRDSFWCQFRIRARVAAGILGQPPFSDFQDQLRLERGHGE
jgi:hypothetical protein